MTGCDVSCTTVSVMQCFIIIHESAWCYPMSKLCLIIIHDTTWHFSKTSTSDAQRALHWVDVTPKGVSVFHLHGFPAMLAERQAFNQWPTPLKRLCATSIYYWEFPDLWRRGLGLVDSPRHKHHPSLLWVCQPIKPFRFVNQQYRIASKVIKNAKAHAKYKCKRLGIDRLLNYQW